MVSVVEVLTSTSACRFCRSFGCVECVKLLLEYGACPNVQDIMGCTPLHRICGSGGVECVKLLLEYGACPNIRNNIGQTPIDIAQVYPNILKLLKN